MRPPTRFDVSEHTFFGLTYRQLGLLAGAGVVALLCLVGLRGWPLLVRGLLALGCAAAGLVWAFWQPEGQTLERKLLDILVFRRRTRHLLHRALRGVDGGQAMWPPAAPAGQPAPRAARSSVALAWPAGLWVVTANAIGASLLTGLTWWLARGGAHALALLWHRF